MKGIVLEITKNDVEKPTKIIKGNKSSTFIEIIEPLPENFYGDTRKTNNIGLEKIIDYLLTEGNQYWTSGQLLGTLCEVLGFQNIVGKQRNTIKMSREEQLVAKKLIFFNPHFSIGSFTKYVAACLRRHYNNHTFIEENGVIKSSRIVDPYFSFPTVVVLENERVLKDMNNNLCEYRYEPFFEDVIRNRETEDPLELCYFNINNIKPKYVIFGESPTISLNGVPLTRKKIPQLVKHDLKLRYPSTKFISIKSAPNMPKFTMASGHNNINGKAQTGEHRRGFYQYAVLKTILDFDTGNIVRDNME